MSILRELIDLVGSLNPADVKKVFDFIMRIVAIFQAQGFQATGVAATPEEEEAVNALTSKGCDAVQARKFVRSLNQ